MVGSLRNEVFACGFTREPSARSAPARILTEPPADKAAAQTQFVMAGPSFSKDMEHAATVTWAQNTVRVNLDGRTTKEMHVQPGLPIYTPARQHAEVPRHWMYESAGNVPNPLIAIPGVLGSIRLIF